MKVSTMDPEKIRLARFLAIELENLQYLGKGYSLEIVSFLSRQCDVFDSFQLMVNELVLGAS